ncbi:protein of unknown function [Magnetospira sp. QH-2]|nr:protein of unknown function [Magnetospira sp. QH-2]
MARMRASFACTLHQLEKHKIDSEFILVDWNPPGDRPTLREAIDWPDGLKHVTIRVFEVSSTLHERFSAARRPLFESAARNVGFRRSRGSFALSSMIDLLYPDTVMSFIADRQLEADKIYRTERVDVDPAVLTRTGPEAQLAACPERVVQRNERGLYPLFPGLPPLFTNASGDFILMSRESWHALRGQREDDPSLLHIDSILMYAALGLGITERIIPGAATYHVKHGGGWDSITERKEILDTGKTVDELWPRYRALCIMLGLGLRDPRFNGPDWGLGDEDLPEFVINRGQWES